MKRILMVTLGVTSIMAGWFVGSLAITPPVAQAQVAAPSLLPGSVRVIDPEQWINTIFPYGENFTTSTDGTITPDNPAAMQWARTSEIAVGQFNSKNVHDDDPSLSDYNYDYAGDFYGARWVRHYFSLGGEVIDWEANSTPIGNFKLSQKNWALSVNLFDVLSLGASKTVQEQNFTYLAFDIYVERKTQYNGASLRLGEIFYLGFVQGTEYFYLLNKTGPSVVEMKRDVQQLGIGISTQGVTKWHLEYQQGTKDGVLQITEYIAREEETAIVLEVLYGQLAAGITSRSVTTSRPTNTSTYVDAFTGETNMTRLSIGWVTPAGFALNAAFESTEIKGAVPTVSYTRQIDTTVLSASFQF